MSSSPGNKSPSPAAARVPDELVPFLNVLALLLLSDYDRRRAAAEPVNEFETLAATHLL